MPQTIAEVLQAPPAWMGANTDTRGASAMQQRSFSVGGGWAHLE